LKRSIISGCNPRAHAAGAQIWSISPVHLRFDINFMEKSAGGVGNWEQLLLADVDFAFAEKFCVD
jgi:hypothetical protein